MCLDTAGLLRGQQSRRDGRRLRSGPQSTCGRDWQREGLGSVSRWMWAASSSASRSVQQGRVGDRLGRYGGPDVADDPALPCPSPRRAEVPKIVVSECGETPGRWSTGRVVRAQPMSVRSTGTLPLALISPASAASAAEVPLRKVRVATTRPVTVAASRTRAVCRDRNGPDGGCGGWMELTFFSRVLAVQDARSYVVPAASPHDCFLCPPPA